MSLTKQQLREEYRQKRRAISPEQHAAWSAAVHEHLDHTTALQEAKVVFSYISCGREVETVSYLQKLLARGVRVLTPATDRNMPPLPQLHEVHLQEDGSVSMPHAVSDLTLADVQVILVPGIVWDRRGYRIGFGGGYFDRLLAQAPHATKVGLAFEMQVVDHLSPDLWDIPVDLLITESHGSNRPA